MKVIPPKKKNNNNRKQHIAYTLFLKNSIFLFVVEFLIIIFEEEVNMTDE